MKNILILGDGNFSFSRGICESLTAMEVSYYLTTTSFDSKEEVVHKYPEVVSIFRSLQDNHNVDVLHGIDASRPLRDQIRQSDLRKKLPVPLESSSTDFCSKYDQIIFNFPHLGFEDLNAHSSLVAHTMYSALTVMEPATSVLTITLTATQYKLWRVQAMASRNGLKLLSSTLFQPESFPGYELRRHHVGKSFFRRVEECRHYSFTHDSCDSSKAESVLAAIKRHYLSKLTPPPPTTSSEDIASVQSAPGTASASTGRVPTGSKPPKKRSKIEAAAQGGYRSVLTTSTTRESDNAHTGISGSSDADDQICSWECCTCSKQFKSEQGARTHVYMIHVLPAAEAQHPSSVPDKIPPPDSGHTDKPPVPMDATPELFCKTCQKPFSNADALYQHNTAKHSQTTPQMTSTVEVSSARPASPAVAREDAMVAAQPTRRIEDGCETPLVECPVCGKLLVNESLEDHLRDGLRPVPGVALSAVGDEEEGEGKGADTVGASDTLRCKNCAKSFRDLRAISQHRLFCSSAY